MTKRYTNPLCDSAIVDRFGIHLPAGLGNLSFTSREAIKSEQKRLIERLRTKLKNDEPITKEDLKR